MAEIFKAYDIRGIYGVDLTEEIAERIGRAFIRFTGAKKVVVGRDMRPHSAGLFTALSRGMLAQGADVDLSIGRTDFPGGNYLQLIDSIRNKILTLPPETLVYPGHMDATSVKAEAEGNPYVKLC